MGTVEMERACQMWRSLWPQKEEPTLKDFREAYERFAAQFPVPEDVSIEAVDASGVPALWVRTPQATDERTVCYFHGGGYVNGSAHGYRELTSHQSGRSGSRAGGGLPSRTGASVPCCR